jgi:hypothetical protein
MSDPPTALLKDEKGVHGRATSTSDRGTIDMSLSASINRLTRFSIRMFARGDLKKLPPLSETDGKFYWNLNDREAVWFTDPAKLNEYFLTLYTHDVRQLESEIYVKGSQWLSRELARNRRTLDEVEQKLLTPSAVAKLHSNAKAYQQEWIKLTGRGGIVATEEHVLQAAQTTGDPWIMSFASHPKLKSSLGSFAVSEKSTVDELKGVFARAREGIIGFRQEIEHNRNHIWRYAPIIAAAVHEFSDSNFLPLLALQLAEKRARSFLSEPIVIVGIVLLGLAATAFTGPLGLILAASDFGLASVSVFNTYMIQRENELAEDAAAFQQGTFTQRESNYLWVLIDIAAALISANALLKGLRAEIGAASRAGETAGARLSREVKPAGEPVKPLEAVKPAENPARPVDKAVKPVSEVERPLSGKPSKSDRAIELDPRDDSAPIQDVLESNRIPETPPKKVKKTTDFEPHRYKDVEAGKTRATTRMEQITGIEFAKRQGIKTPPARISDWAKNLLKPGQVDPVIPTRLLSSGEYGVADHIISVNEIRQWDEFLHLNKQNKALILNFDGEVRQITYVSEGGQQVVLQARGNFVAIGSKANSSKAELSYSVWNEIKGEGLKVDRMFTEAMKEQERLMQKILKDKIAELLKQQYAAATKL